MCIRDSSDVVDALKSYCTQNGVQIRRAVVTDLRIQEQTVTGVRCEDGTEYFSKHVVIACGGMSYPATGSTGDGYRLAQQAGHTICLLYTSQDYSRTFVNCTPPRKMPRFAVLMQADFRLMSKADDAKPVKAMVS